MITKASSGTHGSPANSAAEARRVSWLWCSPPDLPADTVAKRIVDRLLPRAGWRGCVFFLAVAGLWTASGNVSGRVGLAAAAIASLAAGGWCTVNFWRCRHAHCVVTGIGWLALGGLILVKTLLGHSVIGGLDGLVFLAILAVGVLFETGWYRRHRTHAVFSDDLPQPVPVPWSPPQAEAQARCRHDANR